MDLRVPNTVLPGGMDLRVPNTALPGGMALRVSGGALPGGPPPRGGSRPRSLIAIVDQLRLRALDGEPQDSLVKWLYFETKGLGIRMRYDEHLIGAADADQVAGVVPADDVPADDVPADDVPAKDEPAKDEPAEDVPADDEPAEDEPAEDEPAEDVPADDEPAEDEPAEDEPAEDEPADHEPADDEPAKDEPADDKPAGKAKSPPARGRKKKLRRVPIALSLDCGILTINFKDSALKPPLEPTEEAMLSTPPSGAAPRAVTGRIILSSDRFLGRKSTRLCAECNGAVIDARTWRHLVIPPRTFARGAVDEIDFHLARDMYEIVQVSDGTVATIYQWEHPAKGPIWCLATGNGYDVSHLRWMGDLAFAEVLHELLARHPAFVAATGLRLLRDFLEEGDVRLGFTALDPAFCYTVGFRHGNFHPMAADPPAVWNIQAVCLADGRARYGRGLPHVPGQATFSRDDIFRLCGEAGPGPVTVAMFDRLNAPALEDAKKAIGAGGRAPLIPPAPGLHVSPFHYGFILRSRDAEATGFCSDILLESPLLSQVRHFVYRRPPRADRPEVDHMIRLEYSLIRAFLTSEADRREFLALFPEAGARFGEYAQLTKNIVHNIVTMARNRAMNRAARPRRRSPTAIIAAGILGLIERGERPLVFNSNFADIVRDYVERPGYALMFLRALAPPA